MIGMIKTISDLDLGSLQRILSYLRYVDKLKMLLVTKCIAKFAEEIVDSEPFDILHVQIHFSKEELKQLLIDYGRYVNRLRYTEWFSDKTTIAYLRLLPQHCSNLQEVYFSELEISMTNIYGQILNSAQKTIEKLTLENCTVPDPACSLVANLSQLKVLSLSRAELSGKDFGRLRNLIEFNLRECKKFLSENLIDILKSNKLVKLNLKQSSFFFHDQNLKELTVSLTGYPQTYQLMDMFLERYVEQYLKELVNNRVTIESFEITKPLSYPRISNTIKSTIIDQIIQLDNLRALSFRNIELIGNPELVQIAKFCRNIEMLDLCGTYVSDEGIIGCLEYLKDLRHLNLSHCTVKKSLYSRLVKIRNELGIVQKLVVYIGTQKQLEAVLKSDVYADTMAFVQLTLSPMRTVRDRSMLQRLDQLNLSYCNDNVNLIRKAPKSTRSLSPEVPSLLALDDNSLYHIMKYLPLVDQLKLTLSNSRFGNIIKYTNPFEVVEFVENFTVREAKTLLSSCGHMVNKLYLDRADFDFDFDAEYYDLLSKYVTNVVELHASNVNLWPKVVSSSLHSLEAIHIIHCNIDDKIAMEISKATKLHTLSFTRSIISKGIHFGNFTNLINVNLSNVANLEPVSFIAICKSNKLKDLNIIGCKQLNNQSFQVLVETQTNLEILAIGGNYAATNIYLVARLKNLQDLTLDSISREELLQCTDALAELKCNQLEFFDMYCEDVLDAIEILKIAENIATLRNLKYLRIQCFDGINHDFIRTIAKRCPLLKTLALVDCDDVDEEVVLEAIRLFKHLRHFDMPCSYNICLNSVYREALEIMKEAARGPLVLYDFGDWNFILEMKNTREYTIKKKYVTLSSKCFKKLNKYKLVKEETPQSKNNVDQRQPNRKEVASSKPSIIDIPSSCLQRIVSYLQPMDKLVFAYLHKTICVSIGITLDNILHNLNDIARIFTESEARDLFAACAGHIKRIQFSTVGGIIFSDYINLLRPYCSYLIEIDITCCNFMRSDELKTLFRVKDLKLQKLTMNELYPFSTFLEHIASTPSVRSIYSLDVSTRWGNSFNGQYIDKFKHLTDLNLMNCSNIENEYFESICRNCKLQRLNIIGVRSLSESSYKALVNTQNDHLEQLSMSCSYRARNYAKVAKLKNLRHITIKVDEPLADFQDVLKMLVRYRRNDLEYLEIINATQQSDVGICVYDMVEEVKSYFRNLKDIAIKDVKWR